MSMYPEILLPIDDSPGAEDAITRTADLARMYDATIHILYIVDTGIEPRGLDPGERDALRRHSEKRGRVASVRVQEQATERGLKTVRNVREGIPYRSILTYADENAIDLIVMGTHGRMGTQRSHVNSTTERVITLTDVPVLTTRLTEDGKVTLPEADDGMYDHVVIPTDGSDTAERAAEHGLALAERYGAEVHVVYVVDTRTYGFEDAPRSIVGLLEKGGQTAVDEIAADARDRNLPVTVEILRGVPEEELLHYTRGADADLIVMGTRGRGAGSDRLLGSTTTRLIRHSETPVLTVN